MHATLLPALPSSIASSFVVLRYETKAKVCTRLLLLLLPDPREICYPQRLKLKEYANYELQASNRRCALPRARKWNCLQTDSSLLLLLQAATCGGSGQTLPHGIKIYSNQGAVKTKAQSHLKAGFSLYFQRASLPVIAGLSESEGEPRQDAVLFPACAFVVKELK